MTPRTASKQSLAHVLWIGGPPDTGKTSIAERLAGELGARVYHFDRHETAHFSRADPVRTPALWAAHPDRMGPEERWLGTTPQRMAEETIACWSERFAMAVDDLLGLPDDMPVIAEGPGMFPDCVLPLLSREGQAVWLAPTESFKRASVARREKLKGVPVSDLARAVENLIQRDLLMGEHVRARSAVLGLSLIEIDGSESVDEVTERVNHLLSAGG